MACALGAEPAYAVACLANLEPVDNRLVLDRRAAVSFLRDAYNSNPTGFAAALEVLKELPAGRRCRDHFEAAKPRNFLCSEPAESAVNSAQMIIRSGEP